MTLEEEVTVLRGKVADYEAILKQNNNNLLIVFKLTPQMGNILGLLISLQIITPTMMTQRLGIVGDTKVAIHRLRAHLKDYGIEIHSRRHLGYWLTPSDKARITNMISDDGASDVLENGHDS